MVSPRELLDNWEAVIRTWVNGQSMSDLAGGKDAERHEFIEGALVYRLVWAMESVRVREATVNDGEDPYCTALLCTNRDTHCDAERGVQVMNEGPGHTQCIR